MRSMRLEHGLNGHGRSLILDKNSTPRLRTSILLTAAVGDLQQGMGAGKARQSGAENDVTDDHFAFWYTNSEN